MRIKVRFRGPISQIIGDDIELNTKRENYTINDLHTYIRDKYLDKAESLGMKAVIDDLPAQCLIIVNGREISALNGLETVLNNGDEVLIINYTHGG